MLHLIDMRLVHKYGEALLGQFLSGSPLHIVVYNSVYSFVTDLEVDAPFFLPYPLHLALEGLLLVDAEQTQTPLFIGLDVAYIVVTARPDDATAVTKDGSDAGNSRCVDNIPLCIVIVEQSLEIGYIDRSVRTCDDVEILVMSLIFSSTEIPNEGDSLCPCTDRQEGKKTKGQ